MDSTCSRRPARGNSRVVCSTSSRCRIHLRRRRAERTYGVSAHGSSGCAEGTRDDIIVRVRQCRRYFRAKPLYWCDDGRSSWKPGPRRSATIHGESGSVCVGRNGNSVRRYCSGTSHIRHHDFRNDARLFHHRAADDLEPRELLHFVSPATPTDLRSTRIPGRCALAEPNYSKTDAAITCQRCNEGTGTHHRTNDESRERDTINEGQTRRSITCSLGRQIPRDNLEDDAGSIATRHF